MKFNNLKHQITIGEIQQNWLKQHFGSYIKLFYVILIQCHLKHILHTKKSISFYKKEKNLGKFKINYNMNLTATLYKTAILEPQRKCFDKENCT